MTTDKQVEELAYFICEHSSLTQLSSMDLAQDLCKEGYRLVQNGEWLTDKYGMENSVCSICGAVFEGDGGNYCSKCGAKMIKE